MQKKMRWILLIVAGGGGGSHRYGTQHNPKENALDIAGGGGGGIFYF